jgi:uncharacterized membrane protein YphA (DoxX/SURF4 family)
MIIIEIFNFVFGVVMVVFILTGLRGYKDYDNSWNKFFNNLLFMIGLLGFVTYLQW